MQSVLHPVVVAGTGSFLPGEAVPNDRIDDVLGRLTEASPRVQSFVESVARRMLEAGGVKTRHFAVNPETRELTHTVASLGEVAARRALESAGRKPTDVDLLLLATPSYDTTTPPTSTLLQERLGIEHCAEMEIHSNCSGVGKCVQIAHDAIRLGRYRTALVVYSQLSSVYLRACYFNQPQMTKTQAALRYILADGSGAVLFERGPAGGGQAAGHQVLGTFVESVGGAMAPGMTAGGGVADITSAKSIPEQVWSRGSHHLDQDFAAVAKYAGRYLLNGMKRMLESLGIEPSSVAHYVGSIPTRQLYEDNSDAFASELCATHENMKFRSARVGYCGGAAILIHFDEIARSGELKPGEIAVLHSVESSKWMSAGFVVRW